MTLPTLSQVATQSAASVVGAGLVLTLAVPRARARLDEPFRVRRILGRDLNAFTGFPQDELNVWVLRAGQRALRGRRAWAAIYAPWAAGFALAIVWSNLWRLAGDVPHRNGIAAVGAAGFAWAGAWLQVTLERRLIRAEWRRTRRRIG